MKTRKPSNFIVYTRCSRCWERLPVESAEDPLCPDCRADRKPVPQYLPYGASGVAGTYLAGLDREYFAARIREVRPKKERA